MASYATVDDIKARAGRVQGAFSVQNRRPNESDLQQFLDDTAAEIDAAIEARGYNPAGLETATKEGLRDLNAYGALLRGLVAIDPSNLPATAQGLTDTARGVWEGAMGTPADPRSGSIAMGTFPAIAVLEAGRGGAGGQGAGSLWQDDPTYGSEASMEAEATRLRDTNLAPAFSRRQKL